MIFFFFLFSFRGSSHPFAFVIDSVLMGLVRVNKVNLFVSNSNAYEKEKRPAHSVQRMKIKPVCSNDEASASSAP